VDAAAADRILTSLRGTVATMSANLMDLENDVTRTRLDQAPLAGTTATRWAEARGDLASLWQWYAQLNQTLERATELRGAKARPDSGTLQQLDWLLNGPSIELSSASIPLTERGLLGPSETTMRCAPPQLLDLMRAAFDHVIGTIAACAQRWAALDPKVAALSEQITDAQRLAGTVSDGHQPELDRAKAEVEKIAAAAMSDPLGVSDGAVDQAVATVASVDNELRRLVDVKDQMATRLAAAHQQLSDLAGATAAAAAARAEALAKITRPTVVDPRPAAGALEAELIRVETLAAHGDWRAAASLLAQWTTRCGDALGEANRALVANRAPLATRDELRGRLDAYRAKAYRLGRLEDQALAGLYTRARAALFTAPTDLAEAEELVRRYQQALSGPAPREVAT
jgi:hypothetical protein